MFFLAQLPVETLKTQLGNGAILMVLGMAIVFVFLTILVYSTKGISKLVRKIESKMPASPAKSEAVTVSPSADAEIAAAIAAAVVKSKS